MTNRVRNGSVIGIPYISDRGELIVDKLEGNPSWICGNFTCFIPKIWSTRKTQVTTRELRKNCGSNANQDILFSDLEFRLKFQHPNILLLLGICPSDNLESITLVYEQIRFGSLYYVLYNQRQHLTSRYVTEMIIQIVDAIAFVHSHNLIHCAVSSHSIVLTNNGQAKLSCFEYTMEDNSAAVRTSGFATADPHYSVLRHWLAPEVLLKKQFSKRADVYSICSVMWELCHGDIPWKNLSLEALRNHFKSMNKSNFTTHTLTVDKLQVPEFWYHVICLGLVFNLKQRDLELSEIRGMMLLTKTDTTLI